MYTVSSSQGEQIMAQPGFAIVNVKVSTEGTVGPSTIVTVKRLKELLEAGSAEAYTNDFVNLWTGRTWIKLGSSTADLDRTGFVTLHPSKPVNQIGTSSGITYVGSDENPVLVTTPVTVSKFLARSSKVAVTTALEMDVGLDSSRTTTDHSPLGYSTGYATKGSSYALGSCPVYSIDTTSVDSDGVYWSAGVIVDCDVSH
jgi:hypothetical protein